MESVVVKKYNVVDGKYTALEIISEINDKLILKKYSIGILFCAASIKSDELLITLKENLGITILGCSSS